MKSNKDSKNDDEKENIKKFIEQVSDPERKEELQRIFESIERHRALHPLGEAFIVKKTRIYIITNDLSTCRFVFEGKKDEADFFDVYGSRTKQGKKLLAIKKGSLYNFRIFCPERSPLQTMNSIVSEEEFSTLFRRTDVVNRDQSTFDLETAHVLTRDEMVEALAMALERAGKAYGLRVTNIKKITRL